MISLVFPGQHPTTKLARCPRSGVAPLYPLELHLYTHLLLCHTIESMISLRGLPKLNLTQHDCHLRLSDLRVLECYSVVHHVTWCTWFVFQITVQKECWPTDCQNLCILCTAQYTKAAQCAVQLSKFDIYSALDFKFQVATASCRAESKSYIIDPSARL